MTNPTTGGVTASYAMLGDIHIAEPGALICFAGPRVIQQTIREQLPDGFQRAEYLLAHGMIDMVVHRHKMRETLARLCRLMMQPRVTAVAGDQVNGHALMNGTALKRKPAADIIDVEGYCDAARQAVIRADSQGAPARHRTARCRPQDAGATNQAALADVRAGSAVRAAMMSGPSCLNSMTCWRG